MSGCRCWLRHIPLQLELLRASCLFSERLSLYLIKIYGFKSGSMCRIGGGGSGAQTTVFVLVRACVRDCSSGPKRWEGLMCPSARLKGM